MNTALHAFHFLRPLWLLALLALPLLVWRSARSDAGISLGSAATLRFRPYPPTQGRKYAVRELQVEPRSAYSMRGPGALRVFHRKSGS